MALRKKVKQETQKIILDVPIDSDLPLRMEKISKQTGLSNLNLIQKWILQEESLVGLMLYGKGQETVKTKPVSRNGRQKASTARKPKNADYRNMLIKKAKKLKKEGMTLKKISETFNNENIATVSGKGKWYTTSITWLLKQVK